MGFSLEFSVKKERLDLRKARGKEEVKNYRFATVSGTPPSTVGFARVAFHRQKAGGGGELGKAGRLLAPPLTHYCSFTWFIE